MQHKEHAALMIVLSVESAKRDRKGAKWCRKDGIGAARRILGEPLPDGVPDSPVIREYRAAQAAAIEILATHCRVCGRCELANAPVNGRPLLVGIPANHRQ